MTPADRLRALIAVSGLSAVQYAELVMGRNPRTLRRWLAGHPVPPVVLAWIAHRETLDAE